jgi:hypothetical protein
MKSWYGYEATACMEEMKMTVSRGCFDSKETPCGWVIDCDEWIWEKEFDSEFLRATSY